MKKKFVVGFNPTPSEWQAARRVFSAAGHPEFANEPQRLAGYTFRFADEDAYRSFVAVVEAQGLPPDSLFTRIENRIFPGEIASRGLEAPLVWLQVSSAERGSGGPTYGTQYDLAAGCPRCGTGARQISPLYLRPSDAPKTKVWQTLDNEILVNSRFVTALQAVTGLELRQARAANTSEPIEWWQLMPSHELPPMAAATEGVRQDSGLVCPVCRRDGFGVLANLTIRYELDLDELPDVSHTYEYFGRSGLAQPPQNSHFARQLPIVRGHVFERLVAAGVRNIAAEPIEVLDSKPRGRPPGFRAG